MGKGRWTKVKEPPVGVPKMWYAITVEPSSSERFYMQRRPNGYILKSQRSGVEWWMAENTATLQSALDAANKWIEQKRQEFLEWQLRANILEDLGGG